MSDVAVSEALVQPQALRLGRRVVVPLMGLPGAGKTTLADHLVETLGLRRVSRDLVRAAMFPDCRHTLPEKRAAFRGVLLALDVNLALETSCVIDGMTFSRRRDLARVAQVAERGGALLIPIFLELPAAVARERIAAEARGGHPAGDRDPALVDFVLRRFEAPPASVLTIDATLPRERVAELACDLVLARASRFAGG
jgi:predicted kinase